MTTSRPILTMGSRHIGVYCCVPCTSLYIFQFLKIKIIFLKSNKGNWELKVVKLVPEAQGEGAKIRMRSADVAETATMTTMNSICKHWARSKRRPHLQTWVSRTGNNLGPHPDATLVFWSHSFTIWNSQILSFRPHQSDFSTCESDSSLTSCSSCYWNARWLYF